MTALSNRSITTPVLRALGNSRSEVAHLIMYEMKKRGYSQASLARKLGCSQANVNKAVNGQNHSAMVLDALKRIGIPGAYLFDPRDYAAREKEAV